VNGWLAGAGRRHAATICENAGRTDAYLRKRRVGRRVRHSVVRARGS